MLLLSALAAVAWLALLSGAPLLSAAVAAPLYAFCAFICHQLPDRSFHVHGVVLPVCARCLGLYAGAAAGAVAALVWSRVPGRGRRPDRHARALLTLAVLPIGATVTAEWVGVWQPSNVVRCATGIAAGAVAAALVLATLHYEQCAQRRPIAPQPR